MENSKDGLKPVLSPHQYNCLAESLRGRTLKKTAPFSSLNTCFNGGLSNKSNHPIEVNYQNWSVILKWICVQISKQ